MRKEFSSCSAGMALVVVLLLMSVLSALLGVVALLSSVDLRITGNLRRSQQAFYVAEAGLAHALSLLASVPSFDVVLGGGPLSFSFDAGAYSGSYSMAFSDNGDGDGDDLRDSDGRVVVTLTGRVGNAQSILQALVRRDPPGPSGAELFAWREVF